MGTLLAKPEHEVAYQELCAMCSKHADVLSPLELLAIASNMLGKLLAYQDQRTTSRDLAMSVIIANIELGNQQAIAEVMESKGSA